jgi:NADPH-dependent curcumin reductase CurA
VGLPTRADWDIVDAPLPEPQPGGVLVKTLMLSLDPAMRGWMNEGRSYIEPVGLGEVMRAGGVGRVIASNTPAFAVGDYVSGGLGVQRFAAFDEAGLRKAGLAKIDPRLAPLPKWLNALGMPGMTAYFGLLEVGRPQPGNTVVVSGAAGAVGQTVGQIARIRGCRAVGIAGGAAKCAFVVDELGFDACIDYKNGSVRDGLKQHCPQGVDVYFDNVGGPALDAVLARINLRARIALCGMISDYTRDQGQGITNLRHLIFKRARIEGFLVMDYLPRAMEAMQALGGWLQQGRIKYKVDLVRGLENAVAAMNRLLTGANTGKVIVTLAD